MSQTRNSPTITNSNVRSEVQIVFLASAVQQHVKDSSTNTANHFHMFLSPCICILNNEDPLPQEQSVFSKELSLFDAMHAIVAFIGFPGHFISACMHELVCSGLATGGTELNHKKCTLSTEFLSWRGVCFGASFPSISVGWVGIECVQMR